MAQRCTDYLEQRGVSISVSDAVSPWQNGFIESFWGRLKQEFGGHQPFRHRRRDVGDSLPAHPLLQSPAYSHRAQDATGDFCCPGCRRQSSSHFGYLTRATVNRLFGSIIMQSCPYIRS